MPIKHPTRVSFLILEGWEEATVEVLINEDKRTWNEEVVDGLFVPEEAELIKQIPLSRHPTEDKLVWLWTQSRQHSCKSGYRFLKNMDEEEGSVATQVEDKKFWHSIWDLRVPNKVKNLLWQACRDSIPTKANLRRQHITDNSLCERSLSDEEVHYKHCGHVVNLTRYGLHRSGTFTKTQASQTSRSFCHGY